MNTTIATPQKQPTRNTDPVFKESPLCLGYRLDYKSEFRNARGEPVFYTSGDQPYLIRPVVRPRLRLFHTKPRGCFAAYPLGLDIDQNTGEININASNSGMRYTIEFTPHGKSCVARTHVVISGIAYEGGVFSLSNDQEYICRPLFYGDRQNSDGVPSRIIPAGKFGFIPDNEKPTGDLKGLIIDPQTGEINIAETVKSGGLGFRRGEDFPENGTCKEFSVFYQLNLDDSRKSMQQKTSVRVHFFDTREDIPEDLLKRLNIQQHFIHKNALPLPLLLATSLSIFPESPWSAVAFLLAALSSLLFLNLTDTTSSRPSETVITR
jgi:hypothetical protein